jgi:mono/diheme cytochrome c family protein
VKRWCMGLAAVTAALFLAGPILFLAGGISARPEPSTPEAWIARRLRGLAIPSSARTARNPVPLDASTLAAGRAHFADHCAGCHGNDGRGRTEMGRSLYPRAPDMTGPTTQELNDGELFWIIENGIRLTGMPAWGRADNPEASWQLVHFIRHLPQLTPEEEAEMRRLNPRSPEETKELEEEERFLEGADAAPHAHD